MTSPTGIIGEYAKRTGVMLDDGDPIVGISTLLDIAKEHDRSVLSELLARILDERMAGIREAIASNEHPITVEEIAALNRAAARNAQSEMTYAAQALVKQQFWRMSAMGAAALMGLVLVSGTVGAAVMGYVTPTPPELTYQDQPDGSRIGYYYVHGATKPAPQQPESPPPAPTAAPQQKKGVHS
jgi:hypothetical protein